VEPGSGCFTVCHGAGIFCAENSDDLRYFDGPGAKADSTLVGMIRSTRDEIELAYIIREHAVGNARWVVRGLEVLDCSSREKGRGDG
jgi:hypothetical protein